MDFEGTQRSEMMSSLLIDEALRDIPLFGDEKCSVQDIAMEALQTPPKGAKDLVEPEEEDSLTQSFVSAASTAEKLQAIRRQAQKVVRVAHPSASNGRGSILGERLSHTAAELRTKGLGLVSSREAHEDLLTSASNAESCPRSARIVLDHTMLLRSKEAYLFDYVTNMEIVADDPWLKEVWRWVAGGF